MTAAPTWTLILPCAGPLKPPPARRPTWLATAPTGELMIARVAASMPRQSAGDVVVAIHREAEDAFHCSEAIRRAFDGAVRCIVLEDRTAGPAETVCKVIELAGLTGPICIKDSDSFFDVATLPDSSFLAVADIRHRHALSYPGHKSYVRLNDQDMVADVVEKNIVSNLVSCGMYGFRDPAVFASGFHQLARQVGHKRLFVSHVLSHALLRGEIFLPIYADNYVDLETSKDMADFRAGYSTLVLDIDGVIFKNQSRFFPPYWGDPVEPIQPNIDHLRALQDGGAQLIFMTARSAEFRDVTMAALLAAGLRPHALIMDCLHGTRFLVNDFATSNPYPSAVAINVERNQPALGNLLLTDRIVANRDI